MNDFDVVIVGASLAGATAATLLARAGAQVALVERRERVEAHKILCTHYVQAHAMPVLERLGVMAELRERGACPNQGHLWTRYGWSRPVLGLRGLNVRREVLDPAVRRCAATTPGVELMLDTTLNELLFEGGRVGGVIVERDGIRRQLRAPLVVGADGRASLVAKLARLEGTMRPNDRCLYFAYFRGVEPTKNDASLMWLLEPEVAYLFPNADGVMLLACMIPKADAAELSTDPDAYVRRLFERCADAPALDRAHRVSGFHGMIDLSNIARPAGAPGLALIGDAAIATDPLWATGCGFALAMGQALADHVAGAFGNPQGLDAAIAGYVSWVKRELLPHHDLAASYSVIRSFGLLERLMFRAAVIDENVRAELERLASRVILPRRFGSPRNLARASWALLSQRLRPSRSSIPEAS